MNIDFHVHGILSKRKEFNITFFMNEILFAKECGINGIFLCEHYNAVEFNKIHEYLRDNYTYDGDRYIVNNVSIFPAIEVNVKNKGHVVLASDRDSILDIRAYLEKYITSNDKIELEDLLDLADLYNCFKIGAHPCRRGHKLCNHPIELLSRLDALDLNGKDIYKKGEATARDELIELSSKLGKNIITGSDSHTPLQIGALYTKLNRQCITINEIKKCIEENDYSVEIKENLDFKIYSSKILKRSLISAGKYDKNTDFKI